MRKILICVLILLISCNVLHAEEDLTGLSLEECLELALINHPSLRRAKSSTRDIKAQLESLKADDRIKITLTGSANYSGTYKYWDDRTHAENLSINATKLLYDTGKNKLQKQIRNESLQGSIETERNTQITVAANAKRAYYDLVLKLLNRDVEREKLNNLEQHLKTAQGFYDVGQSPFIDVTKAQADVATAKVSLLKAENDILVSQEALKVAMGTDIASPFNVALSTKLLLPQPADDFEKLISTAFNDRPDYKKLQHDYKGGELSVKYAARTNAPTINGSMGSSISKREGSSAARDYTVGINLNVPVADGGAEKAAVESARAKLEQVSADIEILENQITYGVRSAALSLINATDRVKSSETGVKYAEENLLLAQGRYEVGVGDAIELSDAVSSLASSRYTYYQALYDAQTARADLDEALGHLPPEIEGKI